MSSEVAGHGRHGSVDGIISIALGGAGRGQRGQAIMSVEFIRHLAL
ncbi:MAG TPA: hypothetical protein VGX03_09510 [Candidatus Binatia bacterium]|nr:hypothetical protein [Candidatus Binatia bacterium]